MVGLLRVAPMIADRGDGDNDPEDQPDEGDSRDDPLPCGTYLVGRGPAHPLSVATSGPGGPRLALGVATIDENYIRMEVPVEQVAAQIGIFVGNASSVLVAGNNISAPQGRRIQEGVSLYGDYGSRVLVRLNQVINAIVGYSVEPLTTASPSLRLVSENVAIGSQTTVSLGPQVVARDNVP